MAEALLREDGLEDKRDRGSPRLEVLLADRRGDAPASQQANRWRRFDHSGRVLLSHEGLADWYLRACHHILNMRPWPG